MHPLLEKLFQKKEIISSSELSPEEKQTFDNWERILSEGEITVERISNFCLAQIALIETKWKNFETSNERLIIAHTIYKAILECIKAPKFERENLEKYLNQILAKDK